MEQIEGLIAEVRPVLAAVSSNPQDAVSVLVSVGVKIAVRVNALTQLTGVQKREIVVKVLVRALEILKAEELEKVVGAEVESLKKSIEERYAQLVVVAQSAVPSAIDAAIDASRGKLNLRKIKARQCLSCLSFAASTAVSSLAATGAISAEDAKKASLVVRQVDEVGGKVAEKVDAVREAAVAAEEVKPQVA